MRRKSTQGNDRFGITLQYHDRGGMAYDFGLALRLRVFPRTRLEDLGEWRVEACTSDAAGVPIITGWGPTRAAALQETRRSWLAAASAQTLPSIDWDVVSDALSAVRAI